MGRAERMAEDDPGLVEGGALPSLPVETVAPGEGTIAVHLRPPDGCELNEDAPLVVDAVGFGGVEVVRVDVRPSDPMARIVIHARFSGESGRVNIAVACYYCTTGDAGLCMIGEERVTLPLRVVADAPGSAIAVALKMSGQGSSGQQESGQLSARGSGARSSSLADG